MIIPYYFTSNGYKLRVTGITILRVTGAGGTVCNIIFFNQKVKIKKNIFENKNKVSTSNGYKSFN